MRLHVFSDIHADIQNNDWSPPSDVDCDVVVVAGDVCAPMSLALPWLRNALPERTIIYVPGNHDFYSDHRSPDTKTTWEWQREHASRIAADHGIILLDDGVVEIDGVRFIGSTLWTDFMLRPPYIMFGDAVRSAGRMNDYRLIKTGRGRSHDLFRPRDSIGAHKVARKFIETALGAPTEATETVVVTHHSPSGRSLTTPDSMRELDWCYASNLEFLMTGEQAPAMWIHGHIHANRDYLVGGTRILANPRGYPATFAVNAPRENPDFDEHMVVEVGLQPLPMLGV
jgi:3',5'-cyclic AMP phosphodiesterase CpdA